MSKAPVVGKVMKVWGKVADKVQHVPVLGYGAKIADPAESLGINNTIRESIEGPKAPPKIDPLTPDAAPSPTEGTPAVQEAVANAEAEQAAPRGRAATIFAGLDDTSSSTNGTTVSKRTLLGY